jgi:hypothetical protein
VAAKLTVAFVFPTPPSTYALQSTSRALFTTHWTVPDVRCELPGAFAESKLPAVGVYVPGATAAEAAAGNAMAATSTVAEARSFLIMWISFSCLGLERMGDGANGLFPRLTDTPSLRVITAVCGRLG